VHFSLKISFEISNEDRATWLHEHPILLEGIQGLLLKKKKSIGNRTNTRRGRE
jgi:hypothetical protein